jgi:hypothetical protein
MCMYLAVSDFGSCFSLRFKFLCYFLLVNNDVCACLCAIIRGKVHELNTYCNVIWKSEFPFKIGVCTKYVKTGDYVPYVVYYASWHHSTFYNIGFVGKIIITKKICLKRRRQQKPLIKILGF